MLMKFSEKAQKAIVVAESIAFNLGHQNVGSEHLLLSLLKVEDLVIADILKNCGVTEEAIANDLERLFGKTEDQPFYMEYTGVFKKILENAVIISHERQENRVTVDVLCLAMLEEEKSVAHELLASYHVPFEQLKECLKKQPRSNADLSRIPDLINLNDKVQKQQPVIVGRERELINLMEILCRKEKNNALIVGDAGVGKTALVEKLALCMNTLDQNHPLSGKTIYELDLASVVAGTKYRGEFEDKLKKIIDRVRLDGQAIIFIDEIHNLVGAGGAEGAIDASNILKPYLARGELTCIGATTYEEYRRYFEKDRALNRRFGMIDLKEESQEATYQILKALSTCFMHYHQVALADDVLHQIVQLSSRYLNERHQPDAAIDVMDLSCVHCRMNGQKEVDHETVKAMIEKMTGIVLLENDSLASLQTYLTEHIFGQTDLIQQMIADLACIESGLYQDERPKAVWLFAGPTGVGKTALAKLLADHHFGHLIRLDMSEYKEAHSVAKIIGSPPGYIGYEQSSGFLDEVRRYPHSIILLDEIDKAHRDVLHLFLQVFDDGSLEDSQKRKVDFSNSLIIMTTNLGYQMTEPQPVGFLDRASGKERISAYVEQRFSLAFLNRIDEIFCFHHLDQTACREIVRAYLTQFHLQWQPDLAWVDHLISISQIEKYGARGLQREIRHQLVKQFLKEPVSP